MKQKNFILTGMCLYVVCFAFFLTACSNGPVVPPQVQTKDQGIQKLVSLKFYKDNVQLKSSAMQDVDLMQKNYVLLENGDYEFIYVWPFQTANIVVHNTKGCQFGDPGEPLLEFSHYRDNVYEGKMRIELNYIMDGDIKASVLEGTFTAIVN